ncbi:MAG: isoprenyl transferase [Bacteroidetes bacterium]|nr:isoprenyl transferase [Bacteroidota bacterium]
MTQMDIDLENIPEHVAVIMDGNGRWAKDQGQVRIYGHMNGVESVREALKAATELGVKYLTLYAFSTENWNRPKEEVEALMNLLVDTILNEVNDLNDNSVRLMAIGDLESLPEQCQLALKEGIEQTSKNDRITLILALSYSARWELVAGMKKIAQAVKEGRMEPEDITAESISSSLSTAGIPDPELLIRTSGEQRISNFLLWQIAYAELYFSPVNWPDFRKENFREAILEYQNRERRFGKVSEQIKTH